MASTRPNFSLVPPIEPPGDNVVERLKAELIAASAERASAAIRDLASASAEASRLAMLDFLPPGERERFRRIAMLLDAELAGIAALRMRRP